MFVMGGKGVKVVWGGLVGIGQIFKERWMVLWINRDLSNVFNFR